MSAIAILEREHTLIEQALNLLVVIADRLEQNKPVAGEHIRALLAFLQDFADCRHHEKEEKTLFPLLEQRGIARVGGPVGVMLHEHEQGRTMIRIMEKLISELGIPGEPRQQFARVAKDFSSLMRDHIAKENNCLFPMAQTVLTAADQQNLDSAFGHTDSASGSAGDYAQYQSLLSGLSSCLTPPA